MSKGLFITFEGGEGAGKTTQIKRLAASLPDAVITREPGGTPEAEALRTLFIEKQGQNWPLPAQLLLMFAARSLHTENLIKPALAAGKTVISDRYTDSTRVYQGDAGGLSADTIESVKKAAIGDFEPDLTFILDIPVEEGLRRAGVRAGGGDTFESKGLEFHKNIRNGFLTLAKQTPQRYVVINAMQPVDDIAQEILQAVKQRQNV